MGFVFLVPKETFYIPHRNILPQSFQIFTWSSRSVTATTSWGRNPKPGTAFNSTEPTISSRPDPSSAILAFVDNFQYWQFWSLWCLLSTVLTVIFTFGSLASFSYLSAAAGGAGLALMKDMLRKNGPLHFCPPETFISTAPRLTNTNTGQIRMHFKRSSRIQMHFCEASLLSGEFH